MLVDYRDIASHVYIAFFLNPKKFLQFLENIVFKRIKTISWIKSEFNTIQKLIFMY
jgi:hypothetical protein